MAHIGELLSELRQDNGLTQKQLAAILNVSPGTISNYENGVHLPDIETLTQVADYFNVTTDYLLGRTSSNVPSDVLSQHISENKTLADLIKSFLQLPKNRQEALTLIISDMEINHVINEYSKKDII